MGRPYGAKPDIQTVGYEEKEFFYNGTAQRFEVVGNLTIDGFWTLEATNSSTYKTRMLVRLPLNQANFNGDVLLEWINVSGGSDLIAADHPGVYEAGYAFVAISAQAVGISGEAPKPMGLKQWDPKRYGSLNILDDGLSYDIYTQAAKLVKSGKPLDGLKVEKVIAVGASQSGTRLIAYANGVQPQTNIFDAIVPIVAAGNTGDFTSVPDQTSAGQLSRSFPAKIRTDLKVPVFAINGETESLTYFQQGTRQPDTNKFREWEVAGSSHANVLNLEWLLPQQLLDGLNTTINFNNSYVDYMPTADAAYRHVSKWIRDPNYEPPTFPKMAIEVFANGSSDYIRDSNGNAEGGIRLPELVVPIASYTGLTPFLFGTTTNFTAAKLDSLYPTQKDYVDNVTSAAQTSLQQGVILQYRVDQYIEAAKSANVPPNYR
ncbi:hypothetical protein TrVFT333_003385 [Trichoderma virens FT-333]|nr:hypothetical protein TrVFT333_003385 [Trichoderma virens FT-333]